MNSLYAPAIGIFDSGVGGLSLLHAIRQKLPAAQLLYVADSGNAPYGDRTPEFINARCEKIAGFLIEQNVSALVVACNTASVLAIENLRAKYSIPIVGIEPAIKPAASYTRSGTVGVLATSRTVESIGVKRLCELYGDNVNIILQPCPGLVEHIENAELNSAATKALLLKYLTLLIEQGADTIVLGCTHYPFIRSSIQEIVGNSVTVIEPGDAVARQLQRRLADNDDEVKDVASISAELHSSRAIGGSDIQLYNKSTGEDRFAGEALDGSDCDPRTTKHSRAEADVTFYCTGPIGSVASVISQLWGEPVAVRYLQDV